METKIQKNKTSKDNSSIDKIEDAHLKESTLFLISNKIINIEKIRPNEDFEKNLKQEIEEKLKEKYKDINTKVSELRRQGKDFGVLNFKLMSIPLKIKIFLATYEIKDAENLLKRMREIENEIS
jgi:hypothetical protein